MGDLKSKQFAKLYEPLELELVSMAHWVAATGARIAPLSTSNCKARI